MDRFSLRLAASLIDDRHRAGTLERRSSDFGAVDPDGGTAGRRSDVLNRLRGIPWPARLRVGAR
jgi:hypothetical protein